MITALFWILIGLVAFDVIAHLQHLTVLEALRQDMALLRGKIDGGSTP